MTNYDDANPRLIKTKGYLYSLYYEILGEIKGEKISVEQDDYEENLRTIKIPKLIHYIRESIQILLDRKIEEYKRYAEEEKTEEDFLSNYEYNLKKYEEEIKKQFRRLLKYRIKREAQEQELESYKEMEADFEEMKEKLKNEDGKFLNNDRKDNEILILRTENCNLKTDIKKTEEEIKENENVIKADTEIINGLKLNLDKLTKKIMKLEQNQKDINSSLNNSSINININNNGNPSTKWIIKHEEENLAQNSCISTTKNRKIGNESDRAEPPLSERSHLEAKMKFINSKKNKGQEKSAIIGTNAIFDTYKRILQDLEEKNSSSPKKTAHQKNHSVNMQDKKSHNDFVKYFANNQVSQNSKRPNNRNSNNHNSNTNNNSNNNSANNNYIKITNLMSTSKLPVSNRTQKKQIGNPLNRMYISNIKSGSNSANRSSLSIRGSKVNNKNT